MASDLNQHCFQKDISVFSRTSDKDNMLRVPTSSGNHGKPGKSLKKSSMHGKIMEFEKNT